MRWQLRGLVICAALLGITMWLALGERPAAGQEPTTLDEYIDQARATPTPIPTPTVGDPIMNGLLWVYIRVPVSLGSEMAEDGCMVRDEVLDQSLYEHDPFVIADENGAILADDEFRGTTRIRWEQVPWQPGTSDKGWTGRDDTLICRLQWGLPFLPYSPTYQVVVGERARGPYEASWESIVANDGHLILDIGLTGDDQSLAYTPSVVFADVPDISPTPTIATTDAIEAGGDALLVDLTTCTSQFGATRVWVVTEGGDRTLVFDISATTSNEPSTFSLITQIPTSPGEWVWFEIEPAPLVLWWKLVAHGATPT